MKIVDKIAERKNEDGSVRNVPYRTVEINLVDVEASPEVKAFLEQVATSVGATLEDAIKGFNGGFSLEMNKIANKPFGKMTEAKATLLLQAKIKTLLASGKRSEGTNLAVRLATEKALDVYEELKAGGVFE